MIENTQAIELAVGRSSVRQRILALLMDESGGRLHLREIQRRASTSPGTASRELGKLVAAGLIEREAEGNQVYFRASTSPVATMLRSLLMVMPAQEVGPRPPRMPRARMPKAKTATEATTETITPELAEVESVTTESSRDLANIETAEAPRIFGASRTAATRPAPDPVGLEIAGRFAESIRSIYGEDLRGTYLYGARAAGPAPADADIETIIVLDRVDKYGAELERTSHLCASLSHESRLIVSRIFVAEEAWNAGPDGGLPAIRAEAVAG
jgi:DNA-binding transcriptional ArsR family regulator